MAIRRGDAQAARIEGFIRDLERFFEKNIVNVVNRAVRDTRDFQETAVALGGLERSLNDLGLPEIMADELADLYFEELAIVRSVLGDKMGRGVTFGAVDRDITAQLIAYKADDLFKIAAATVGELRSVALDSILANEPVNLDPLAERLSGRMLGHVRTELNTSSNGFNRAVMMRKSKELGITHFRYGGTLVRNTRPFCRERVGRIFSINEIKTWDNGQGLPALTYLGGYNCRHRLDPIVDEDEIRESEEDNELII